MADTVKTPTAYRTIGEVAEEIGVAQHVLRFWETRFAQIRPMKSGGNRRYYRPQDVELLKQINRLLHDEGYTIKGVQKLLRERGAGGAEVLEPAARPPAETVVATAPPPQADLFGAGIAQSERAALLSELLLLRDRLARALAAA